MANASGAVKLALLVTLCLQLVSLNSSAAPPGLTQPSDWGGPEEIPEEASEAPSESLPEIEARTSRLKAVQTSSSGRVFLMETITDPLAAEPASEQPIEGRLLLLRDGDRNVMAVRVLKTVPDSNQLIVKTVRQYDGQSELPNEQEYLAIEKVSDKAPPPPTPEDQEDIAEVQPVLPFDPDLDAGSSPNPDDPENRALDATEEEPDRIGLSVEEVHVPFERHKSWMGLGVAKLRNDPGEGQSTTYYTGGGIRYGYNVSDRPFVKDERRLDFITLEGGLYYYKVLNLDTSGDSYSIMPLLATARYNYFFNEDFGLFGYLGFVKNIVTSSNAGISDSATASEEEAALDQRDRRIAALSQFAPALGLGALLRVGPQWYARLDAGIDILGLSLMLRF